MGIFESFKEIDGQIVNDGWVQILDDKSNWTIEDFPYDKGVDETITKPHCWKCVTVNQCWFKNEDNKMPKEYDYGTANVFKLVKGLYHPNCHCEKNYLKNMLSDEIVLIIPRGKIDWMIKDKGHLLLAMGYKENEYSKALEIIKNLVTSEYSKGKYLKRVHDNMGFRISMILNFPGINEKSLNNYEIKTGWTIFPNKKLKCNTIIGGLKK